MSDKMGCLPATEGYWARKPMHGDPKRGGAFIFDSRDNSVSLTVFSCCFFFGTKFYIDNFIPVSFFYNNLI